MGTLSAGDYPSHCSLRQNREESDVSGGKSKDFRRREKTMGESESGSEEGGELEATDRAAAASQLRRGKTIRSTSAASFERNLPIYPCRPLWQQQRRQPAPCGGMFCRLLRYTL